MSLQYSIMLFSPQFAFSALTVPVFQSVSFQWYQQGQNYLFFFWRISWLASFVAKIKTFPLTIRFLKINFGILVLPHYRISVFIVVSLSTHPSHYGQFVLKQLHFWRFLQLAISFPLENSRNLQLLLGKPYIHDLPQQAAVHYHVLWSVTFSLAGSAVIVPRYQCSAQRKLQSEIKEIRENSRMPQGDAAMPGGKDNKTAAVFPPLTGDKSICTT